jgi:hypothetical protein
MLRLIGVSIFHPKYKSLESTDFRLSDSRMIQGCDAVRKEAAIRFQGAFTFHQGWCSL